MLEQQSLLWHAFVKQLISFKIETRKSYNLVIILFKNSVEECVFNMMYLELLAHQWKDLNLLTTFFYLNLLQVVARSFSLMEKKAVKNLFSVTFLVKVFDKEVLSLH